MNESRIPYSAKELFRPGKPRVYRGRQLDSIAFPLGGIGTGSISLAGNGMLRDFEIFNRPDKGLQLKYTFFSLYAKRAAEDGVFRVLQGPATGSDLSGGGFGLDRNTGAGLPHFRSAEFVGEYPFAKINFSDARVPLEVSLEACNPFIPLNPDDSGLPAAMFTVHLRNPAGAPGPVEAVLFANLENRSGHPEMGEGRIEVIEENGLRALNMTTSRHAPDSPRYGSLVLATPHADTAFQTHWLRGGWFDSFQRFLDCAREGRLEENREPALCEKDTDVGSLAMRAVIEPGACVRIPVWIVWHTPNFEMYWAQGDLKPVWKNYYATQYADAAAVARYIAREHARLEKETRAFADSLFASTLPEAALDAVSSQLSILKSTTCLRLTDGTFYGFEGCFTHGGCCEGTCSHVWNYSQALAWLFPALERSSRQAEFTYSLHDSGHISFRMPLPLGKRPPEDFHAAADGQMGEILRLYREWQVSGDEDFLRRLWPSARRALEYAWTVWDMNRDGVCEGIQHNTYDIEFHGPNTMVGTIYLAALLAGERMARHLGEEDAANEYRRVFESGRRLTEERLYNGEFYIQKVETNMPREGTALFIKRPEACECSGGSCASSGGPLGAEGGSGGGAPPMPKYQYGEGCLSDQLIGQWIARMLDLGDVLDPQHVHSALDAIYRNNWRATLAQHATAQRIYALDEEAGLLLATWPRGGRPEFPFPYSDEVWCGIEYQVASHMIYEGMVGEGLAIVKGVRDRHTGERRNPWNEFECGSHYARSLASYSVLLALSGFTYSAPEQRIGFAPRVSADNFTCFFCVGSGWGVYRQKTAKNGRAAASIEMRAGTLKLREFSVGMRVNDPSAILKPSRRKVECQIKETIVRSEQAKLETRLAFDAPVILSAGDTLQVKGQLRSE